MNKYEVQEELRKSEADLEKIGRSICSTPGSGKTWSEINNALEHVRDAIRSCYLIEE